MKLSKKDAELANEQFPLTPTSIGGISLIGPEKYLYKGDLPLFMNAIKLVEINQPKYFYISRENYLNGMTSGDFYKYAPPDGESQLDDKTPLDMPFSSVVLDLGFFWAQLRPVTEKLSRPRVVSIFCRELEPGNYKFAATVVAIHNPTGKQFMFSKDIIHPNEVKAVKLLLREIFHRRSKTKFFDEIVERKIKVGKKGSRSFELVSRITHITLGGETSSSPVLGGEIDWNHCWGVRGHWRLAAGLGKDREGNYTVSGYTWVVPHVRGNKEAPFIEKTKILKIISSQEAS